MSDPTPPGFFATITTFLARIPSAVIDTTLYLFGWGHQGHPDDIFPPTAKEFLETETKVESPRPICSNIYNNIEFRQSYVFGRGSHQFYIFVDTMTLFLNADGYMLKEVDLSLPDNAMPYSLPYESREQMCYCIGRYIRVLAYINLIKCHPLELYRKTLIDNLMYELDQVNEWYERHDKLTRHRFEEFIENEAANYHKGLYNKGNKSKTDTLMELLQLHAPNEHTLRSDILRSCGNLKMHQIDEIDKIMYKLETKGWYKTLTTRDRTEEFIEMLTANSKECHDKLVNALRRDNIDVIVSPFTKSIFVTNCDWNTLYKISKLVDELNCDLTVSGGGTFEYTGETILGEYMMYPHVLADDRSQSNTAKYNKSLQIYRERSELMGSSIKVGVMDSGCSLALYESLKSKKTAKMHPKMFDLSVACDSKEPKHYERDYEDSYNGGHGSAIVEIITNCVPPQTKIYVASLGKTVDGSKVEAALCLLSEMDVRVINCSLSAGPSSVNIGRALRDLQYKGVVVVVSARNRMKPKKEETNKRPKPKDAVHVLHPTTLTYTDAMDPVSDALFSGNTIKIGSHNDDNKISTLSAGRCEIDACCRGENVFLESVKPSVRYGNSYAAPYATAIIVIGLSFRRQRRITKYNIGDVLDYVTCECATHHGKEAGGDADVLLTFME